MHAPPWPDDEHARLLALAASGLLDTPAEERFDRITRLAKRHFGVDTCLISLVDAQRQWFKSRQGLDACETDRAISFCGHAILSSAIFEVADALEDIRFSDNPLVTGAPFIRFYAGAPLATSDGHRIGTLCLIDARPRTLDDDQRRDLRDFADVVEHEIDTLRDRQLQHALRHSRERARGILRAMPDLVFVLRDDGVFVDCVEHPDLTRPVTEIIGRSAYEVLPNQLAGELCSKLREALETDKEIGFEYRWNVGGHLQNFEARLKRINGKEALLLARNITQVKQAAEDLRRSNELLAAVVEANNIGTWQWTIASGEVECNAEWASMLGYTRDELAPMTYEVWKTLLHPDDVQESLRVTQGHLEGPTDRFEVTFRMRHKDGHWVWVRSRGRVAARDATGKPLIMLGTHFDESDQHELQERLAQESRARRAQAEHTRAIVEHIVDGIVSINQHGIVESFNPAAERMFGLHADNIVGQNLTMLMPEPHRTNHNDYLGAYLKTGQKHIIGNSREMEAVRSDGSVFPIELTVSEIRQDERITFVGMIRDITRRKAAEEEVTRLAFYDPLTGLPNRRLLLDRLGQARRNARRHVRYGALLYIDLDNFKTLNDSAGHHQGDALLKSVAERLCASVRAGDTVARLGGDEFVVMLEDIHPDPDVAASAAEHVAEKILEALARPYQLEAIEHYGSGSIGVTLFSAGEHEVEDLLKQADLAMYQAKASGRNAIRFFDPRMQVTVLERAAIEKDLRNAVRKHEFEPYFQLQVDADGTAVGAELLLRWDHPQRGRVSPADFIPLAEETGLIVPIGYDVLRAACNALVRWQDVPEMSHLTLSVNISLVQFRQADFTQKLEHILAQTGADARRLKLEVTESLFANDLDGIVTRLHTLKALGLAIALDDFGTGYSSLSYLKNLPLDQIKIDKSFVHGILENPSDTAIARAVIALADSIGLEIIAEGVETQAQRDILAEIGCCRFQGFLFGRPVPLGIFEALISR